MPSRKQIEEMSVLLSVINGFISEEEFAVVYEAYQTRNKNPIFPHGDYDRFALDNLERGRSLCRA